MDFFFRSTSVNSVIQTGIDLGLLRKVKDPSGNELVTEAFPGRDSFRVIGPIHVPTGKKLKVEGITGSFVVDETAPSKDASGNVYQHMNMRVNLPCDVDPVTHKQLKGAWLTALAISKIKEGGPAAARLQAALADLDGMFIVNEAGEPRDPSNPHEVLL